MTSPSRTRHGRRGWTGFTLIELLVVVAIIALLIAILMPSLARARNQARSAACASNMKQALNGVYLQMTETAMRKEKWSTNFGWAVHSLKQNKGQTELFTCPADPNPRPVAAVLDRLYTEDSADAYVGTTSGDAVFTRVFRQDDGAWRTDIQDQTDPDRAGGDAYADPEGDLLIDYTPRGKLARFADATIYKANASWRHDVLSYKGESIAINVSGSVSATIPLLWMSYGANASAGLKVVKGMPLLIAEAGKLGIFPERFGEPPDNLAEYPSDHLAWALRFRHGGRAQVDGLAGVDWSKGDLGDRPAKTGSSPGTTDGESWYDDRYEPQNKLNAGFIDGHIESMGYWQLMDLENLTTTGRPTPNHSVWFGRRRPSTVFY